MADTVVEALILDLLEWLASGERSYEEVIGAWRTSCPKLPVWEDANDRGLVRSDQVDGRNVVRATLRASRFWSGTGPTSRHGHNLRLRSRSLPILILKPVV
jgi:hypothetical protein